jgi:hypothetical protein
MKKKAACVEVGLTTEQIILAVKRLKKPEQQEFLEDLLAATSPQYLASIREAKADVRAIRAYDAAKASGEKPVPFRDAIRRIERKR